MFYVYTRAHTHQYNTKESHTTTYIRITPVLDGIVYSDGTTKYRVTREIPSRAYLA